METAYKKNKGCAGLKGVQFQIHLIIVFFLNALHKLKDWKISTENENTSKFDDVVLELADKSLILLQAKHKEHKKITKEQLLSTNSKNDDFSLLKYFFSYLEIKNKYTVKSCIICTNTNIYTKGLDEFLIQKKISSDSLLYFKNNGSLCYTFSEKLLPDLKVNAEIYYDKNLRGKDIDKTIITEKNLREFLKKLQFFSNFPNGETMNNVIEQLLSRLDSSLLWFQIHPKDLYKKIEEWFLQHRGEFLTQDRGKVIFCETRSEMLGEKLRAYNVQFDDSRFKVFSSKKIVFNTTEEGHFLRILKVYHNLQHCECKTLYTNPSDNVEALKKTIEAFGLSRHIFLVIIFSCGKYILGNGGEKLNEILEKYEYKKVIFITDDTNTLTTCMGSACRDADIFDKSVGIEDFSTIFLNKLIKKKNIIFQDRAASLEELLALQVIEDYKTAVNEELLEKLIKDEDVKAAALPSGLDEHIARYYINRTFKKTLKRVENENMNIDRTIRSLTLNYSTNSSKTQFSRKSDNSNEGEGRIEKEKTFPEDDIYEVKEKVILIADSAGMGKSTVLTKLAMTIKQKDPNLLVLKVELNEYTSFLKEASRRSRNSTSVEELLNSNHETKLTSHLEKFIFSMDSKVVLMLDGIDEISPDYTQLILEVLRQCQKDPNFAKIFITTRPHMTWELEEVLKIEPYVLEPFTEQNQVNFLTSFWTYNLTLTDDYSKEKCAKYAKELIDRLTKMNSNSDVANNFAAIPLQVRMLAEIFQESVEWNESTNWRGCKEYIVADEAESNLPEVMDITNLYGMFIKKKLDIFLDKGNPTGNPVANHLFSSQFDEYFSLHQRLALQIILDQKECSLFSCFQQFNKNMEVNLLKIGIVQSIDNKFNFVHRSFAEYFVARSIFSELQLLNDNNEFLFLFIDKILREDQFKITRAFLNNFLQDVVDSLPSNIFNNYKPVIRYNYLTGSNLIHRLAAENCTEILKLLLKSVDFKIVLNKEVNIADIPDTYFNKNGETSISSKMLSMYRYFKLKSKSNIKHVNGNTLHVIQWLTRHGEVNIKDEDEMTPLCYAIEGGHWKMVRFLIDQGANMHNIFKYERSAILIAASWGHLEIFKFFIQVGLNINIRDARGNTALHLAAWQNHLGIVKFLIEQVVDLDTKNCANLTALHLAVFRNDLEMINCFVENGADINIGTDYNWTVLHMAAGDGHVDTVKYFLDQDMDIDIKDENGNTIFHAASMQGRLEMLKFLVDKGGDYNILNTDKESPLHVATTSGYLDCVAFLLDLGIDINIADGHGYTPLHRAAWNNFLDAAKLLVDRGAEMDRVDVKNQTSLCIAVWNSHLETIKFLLEAGADPSIQDCDGQTALQIATENCQSDVIKLLTGNYSDMDVKTSDGSSAHGSRTNFVDKFKTFNSSVRGYFQLNYLKIIHMWKKK